MENLEYKLSYVDYRYDNNLIIKCGLISDENGLTLYSIDKDIHITVSADNETKLYEEFREALNMSLLINKLKPA
jgi:hypothetical protein